jgi:flavin reductase (DIM6/NTAB) family NADH-FMN oxidoreductase RutF
MVVRSSVRSTNYPHAVEEHGLEQRALFRRWPAGVSVVVAELDGRRAGLTVSSLVSLSLEPRLVGISISQQASLHEVLRDAGEWGVSILGGDHDHLAQHFSRGVPPIALWDGIAVREDDPRLLAGAVGWITARTAEEFRTGDHTFFVGEVLSLEHGAAPTSLVYLDREYRGL